MSLLDDINTRVSDFLYQHGHSIATDATYVDSDGTSTSVKVLLDQESDSRVEFKEGMKRAKRGTILIGNRSDDGVTTPQLDDKIIIGSTTWIVQNIQSNPDTSPIRLTVISINDEWDGSAESDI